MNKDVSEEKRMNEGSWRKGKTAPKTWGGSHVCPSEKDERKKKCMKTNSCCTSDEKHRKKIY